MLFIMSLAPDDNMSFFHVISFLHSFIKKKYFFLSRAEFLAVWYSGLKIVTDNLVIVPKYETDLLFTQLSLYTIIRCVITLLNNKLIA